ncbi:serine hydrolase-like protein [Bradysia coprophila]|uniref:serine hydrolase-like protein n=1 Tax=Bradysia coprophila TaxID=38358 RepID=UPI00187DBB2A|nr:serine hydrolase-like protein [Bradysia coprophila]
MAQQHLQHIREVEEITIPVPWGHIAAKFWGPKHVRPILCLHGWQDNAGTFDSLIPMLPNHVSYLAIDLPGHGLSSRYPDGMIYSHIDYLYTLVLICKKLQWEKVSLMAHSMGAIIGFLFAAAYPEKCDMVVSFDTLKPFVTNFGYVTHFFNNSIEDLMVADIRNQEKSEPPSYKYEELIDRLTSATILSVTRETAPYLLKRAIKPSAKESDKYYFTRDSRLKSLHAVMLPHETNLFLAKRIKAPYCFIKATQSSFKENRKYFNETVDVMKENPQFELHGVDSAHHVHLTEPEKVSVIVSNFINKCRPLSAVSKL